MIMIDNMTYKKYTSQVSEIICDLDIKIYFQKFDSLNNNKGSKRIGPHNNQFTSHKLNPLYNQLH